LYPLERIIHGLRGPPVITIDSLRVRVVKKVKNPWLKALNESIESIIFKPMEFGLNKRLLV